MTSINEDHPQLVPDININDLKDSRINKKIYDSLLIHLNQTLPLCNFKDNPNYPIYYSDEDKKHKIYCLDLEDKEIVCYMEYEIQSCDFINQDWGTQIMVWRGGNAYEIFSGLSMYVLFEILLPKVKVIMTDTIQTPKGKDFWEMIIRYSFNKNKKLKVYFINFQDKTFTLIPTYQKSINLYNKFKPWKDNDINKNYRFAISQNDINYNEV